MKLSRLVQRIVPFDACRLYVCPVERFVQHDLPAGFEFREVLADELAELAKDPANDMSARTVDDCRRDMISCRGVFAGEELAGYGLMAQGYAMPHLNSAGFRFRGFGMHLPDGVTYLFKGFMKPAWRGQRVVSGVVADHIDSERRDGREVVTLITTTAHRNRAGNRNLLAMGFTHVGDAYEAIIAGRHLHRLPPAVPVEVAGGARGAVTFTTGGDAP